MFHHDEIAVPQEVDTDQLVLVNILARYPGQFDVLRELIQNADDAEAPAVEVHFRTNEAEGSLPAGEARDVSKLNVSKWIIRNEGSFGEQDWDRLGKIAAGNADSTKVGAFGVGFYSVLSKSDRPLVKSNGKSLQFSRGEDGKLRKRLARCAKDTWTSVELELRVPEPFPSLDDLTRFLVSSMALLTYIRTISIYLDSQRLLHIGKESRKPVEVPIPPHLHQKSPSEALTIESIQHTVQKVTIDATEWAFPSRSISSSPPVDDADVLVERLARAVQDRPAPTPSAQAIVQENAITHDLYTATTSVILHPESKIKAGVESSMKSLPSSFTCKGVYFNFDQCDSFARASNLRSSKAHLFSGPQGIFPENDNGRLFIGQSTNQTTGIGLHISAHFLPTMERGSIDLANGQIAAWNKEVLWVSGFLARMIYEEEMHSAKSKNEVATDLGLRTMARFAFGSTAPHSGVSQILQDAFFSCQREPTSPFPVVSDVGICYASDSQFRQSNKDLSFLKKYRVLHENIEQRQHSEIIKRYKIPLFTYTDIVNEFEAGVTQDTMKSFFVWWQDAQRNSSSSKAKAAADTFCKKFASRGVLHSSNGVKIELKDIKYFTFFPLPDDFSPLDNIYIDVTSGVPTREAIECFGWTQLSLLDWLKYSGDQARRLASSEDPDVGRRMLRVLLQFALGEETTPGPWNQVADLVQDVKCIPTNKGLRLPADSYFDEADIFRNLPVAREQDFLDIPMTYVAEAGGFRYRLAIVNPGNVRVALMFLGVRQMMEWKGMIEKLETSASEESNDRLLRLLAMIVRRGELTDEHINDLKMKRVFYSQNHGRVSATELHFPSEDMRKLGLPILALPWNGITSLQSAVDPSGLFAVEQFIESLGIQKYPTLKKIIEQAASASEESEVQKSALQYFLANLETRYKDYKPDHFADIAFIPTRDGSLACLNEVFESPVWEKLGFKQASEALRHDFWRLGVKEHPSVDTLIEHLESPAHKLPDLDTANIWFEYITLHGKFSIIELREQFSTIAFVPVKRPAHSSSEPSTIKYFTPKECFIMSSDLKKHHLNIFPYVDFGQNGNSFLESCCAKNSPDACDIARKIVEDPQEYLKALGNDTNLYLEELRTVASQLDLISEDDKIAMQRTPMFLAFQEYVDSGKPSPGKLLPAHQVVISDWESRDFGDNVFLAPKENVIEKMYHKMGSQFLGTYVRYDVKPADPSENYSPPFNRDQIIRCIRYFMRHRDESEKTEVSFYDDEGSTDYFRMRVCQAITIKKIFAPPYGVLADGMDARIRETEPHQVKAGFELGKSYTLWVVKGPCEWVNLCHDIAVALCRVLLKTFAPNDLLLLASLINMDGNSLEGYYSSEVKSRSIPSAPAEVKSKKKDKVGHLRLAKFATLVRVRRRSRRSTAQQTIVPEDDVLKAVEMCCGSDSGSQPYDFNAPCQSPRINFEKSNSHCKEDHRIKLKEKEYPQDGDIRFFLAHDAQCQEPPQAALQAFSKLISNLADVFGLTATTACYIFWKDTDEELMAFNRDQRFIFFNLAHYLRFSFHKDVEEKKLISDWFLIMAHQIAHNGTLDHDEYHGSLTSRLVFAYLPALHKHFKCFTGEAQLPQGT